MNEEAHVPILKHIEAIMTEREKALKIAADALQQRLDYERQIHRGEVDTFSKQITKLESKQSWMFGVGTALIAIAGIVGGIVGHLIK